MTTVTHHDVSGKPLVAGSVVRLLRAPAELLRGLPSEDREAIKALVGRAAPVIQFDASGNAELEFTEVSNSMRTIWVNPAHLEPQPPE